MGWEMYLCTAPFDTKDSVYFNQTMKSILNVELIFVSFATILS